MSLAYLSPDEFYLSWRFFEDAEKYTLLSQEERRHFKPLSEESSRGLWAEWGRPLEDQWFRYGVERPTPTIIEGVDGDWVGEVRAELAARLPFPPEVTLFFFWNPTVGVETTWGLFLEHWDDFCYPSDEGNIGIVPDRREVLIYQEERFWVVSRRSD